MGDLASVHYVLHRQRVVFIEQTQDRRLKAVGDHLVVLRQIVRLELDLTVVVEPNDLSALELPHVELTELVLGFLHLAGQRALRDFLERPVARCEDLGVELNPVDLVAGAPRSLTHLAFKVGHDLLGFDHVLEHGLDLVDGVVTALYLELVDHEFLSLAGHTCPVQESLGEEFGERGDKLVSAMEAAEEPDHCVQLLVDLIV